MGSPSVRLLLRGQQVQEVPFTGPVLRIGRMKENDLVVNNLSVSRFHATLAREGDGFVLRDLGSENGCWVNGRRVSECAVGPGDTIQIGKHHLEIVPAEPDAAGEEPSQAAAPPRRRSDPWDASATYLAGPDTGAKMRGVAAPHSEPGAADEVEAVAPPRAAAPASGPAPQPPSQAEAGGAGQGVALFGPDSDPVAGPDLDEYDVSEMDLREPEAAPVEAEPLGADDGDEPTVLVGEDESDVDPGAEPAPAAPSAGAEGPLHAGLIVQRGGQLERVIQWEAARLTLGRAAECEVLLATPEVSRRHALLVRDGDRYEVRDLESINGTFVNGEKVARRVLQVGDVIRIEDFELTFVLDRAPVGEAVRAAAPPARPARSGDSNTFTQLGEVLDLAPFAEEDGGSAMSFDASAAPVEEAAAAGEAEEKDLAPAPAEGRVVRLTLRLRMDELPPALRDAFARCGGEELSLPAELHLATDEG